MMTPRPALSTDAHRRGGRIAALWALIALGALACTPFERAVTPAPDPSGKTGCAAVVRAAAIVGDTPMVACDGTTAVGDGLDTRQTIALTAALPIEGGARGAIVATEDGRLGQWGPDWSKPPKLVQPPALPPSAKPALYSYRPAGHASALDTTVVALYWGDHKRAVAVTAGAGAYTSGDYGATWKRLTWLPRFESLNGSRPLEIRDLIVAESGLIAFLYYPEGRQTALEQLPAQLAAEAIGTRNGGGPLLGLGQLADQKVNVRSVPLGRDHRLMRAPGDNDAGALWLMVSHPERHEMTRFLSRDWGLEWLDIGYYNMLPLQVAGSPKRAAFLGITDQGDLALWLHGRDQLIRYAHLAPPPLPNPSALRTDDPPSDAWLLAVSDAPLPSRVAIGYSSDAHAFVIDDLGPDVRLLWYYLPLGLLLALALALIARRALYERRVRAELAAKNANTKATRGRDPFWRTEPLRTKPRKRRSDPDTRSEDGDDDANTSGSDDDDVTSA